MDLELIKIVLSALTLLSIVIAYVSYRNNVKRQEKDESLTIDKEVLAQALRSLEWAYLTLMEGSNEEHSIPKSDRLNWLTSARHIQRYKSLKSMIITDTYKLICDENEEYWRHKFYKTLDQPALRNRDYYTNKSDEEWPENIELTSAMVISDFSNWPDGLECPLDNVDRNELIKQKAFNGRCGRGIESYYCLFEECKKRFEMERS